MNAIQNIEPAPLTPLEAARLCQLEQVVERELESFVRVGSALLEIRESRLWRDGFSDFQSYCRDRWGMSGAHAYRFMEGAKVVKHLGIAPTIPEKTIRPLTRLEPEKQAEAWQEAKKASTDGKPTTKQVERAAAKIVPSRKAPEHPDAVALRIACELPPGAPVEIIEPDSQAEPEPPAADADLSDEDWLAACPVRSKLTARLRMLFDLDALAYRKTAPLRERFRRACVAITNKTKKDTKGHIGPWLDKHLYYVARIKHPRHWNLCADCRNESGTATGQVKLIGPCPSCRGDGYRV